MVNQNITNILQNTFGLEAFREGQEEIITSIIEGNNTLVYMPTGGGKSLTYQIPGIYRQGLTIVISPLISLMKDQVDSLKNIGVKAELINSTLSGIEKKDIFYELSNYDISDENSIQFLYIAPERLNSSEFISILQRIPISLIAIDEAHCISQWGHDFRPSYLKIKSFIQTLQQKYGDFPVVGLTATATSKVRSDIVDRLGLSHYREFIAGFDRKNIVIVVREISEKEEKLKKLTEVIEKTPGTGIVYCSSRKHVNEVQEYLHSQNITSGIYRGDLDASSRETEHNKFMNDEYKVIVATNAFGMGIDKKDIRFVVHYNLPGSIENYYQEIGRAGRDGKMSYAVTLASYGDTKIQEFFIENTYPDKQTIVDFYNYLYKDIALGNGRDTQIAKTYYIMASESGIKNDMIVGSIIKILEKYGVLRRGLDGASDDFRGRGITLLQNKQYPNTIKIDWKHQENLKNEGYYKLSEIKRLLFYPSCRKRYILEYFGDKEDLASLPENCGLCDFCLEKKNYENADLEDVIPVSVYALILETVKKYNEKFGIKLLAKVLTGSREERILSWNLDNYTHYDALSEYNIKLVELLFEALISEEFLFKTEGQYPCIGLTELGRGALYKNAYLTSRQKDLNIFLLAKGITKLLQTPQSKKSSLSKPKTTLLTKELFKEGKTLREIAKERELALQTIESHIISLYESGEISLSDILGLIDLSEAKIIKQAVQGKDLENVALKEIKEELETLGDKHISYFTIKASLALIRHKDL